MTIAQMKQQAKASLSGNWGTAIGVYLIAMVLISVLTTTGIGGLFTGLISFGLCSAFLSVIRVKTMKIENLFDCTKNFGTVFVANILMGIYTFLWSLLFVIPGIVKSYSYAMTNYILLDNPNMTASEAITESRKMMDGHKLELFILDLSFIGWYFLSVFTFGILLLYVEPYMMATRAAFYENLRGPIVTEAPAEETATV